jgi:hypothetical protein
VHKDRLDPARGVFPLTQAARVLALALGVPDTGTLTARRGDGAGRLQRGRGAPSPTPGRSWGGCDSATSSPARRRPQADNHDPGAGKTDRLL